MLPACVPSAAQAAFRCAVGCRSAEVDPTRSAAETRVLSRQEQLSFLPAYAQLVAAAKAEGPTHAMAFFTAGVQAGWRASDGMGLTYSGMTLTEPIAASPRAARVSRRCWTEVHTPTR